MEQSSQNPAGTGEQNSKHPADLADQLERLPPKEATEFFHRLPSEQAAAVLGEVEPDQRRELIERLSPGQVADVVSAMPHDRAADLLSELPAPERREILRGMPRPTRSKLADLMRYPAETAGGIMSDAFLTLRATHSVGEALRELQRRSEEIGSQGITYLYVTDDEQRLVGVVPLRDLVFCRPDRLIRDTMKTDVKFVHVDDDQEAIARFFDHYHFMALPVLERDGRLAGIVTADTVIDVLQNEATEDMQLMVGLSGEERARTPWQKSFGPRLKWLCINLGTAFLAASVVQLFEGTIAKWTALAVFLPIVAGQGGNAGIQTLTVMIRELALGEMTWQDGRRALLKESILGLLNGLAIGFIVGLVGYWWKGNVLLGVVVGVAMVMNMVAAATAGVLVPFTLRAMKIDPAIASGIWVTTVTDVAGFFFFLGLAALALAWFV